MNLVDANVLLYAVNTADPKHARSKTWLDEELSGGRPVAFAWIALLAFVRLSTRVGLFPRPLAVGQAMAQVRDWLAQPSSVVIEATPRHADVLTGLLLPLGAGGNLTSDAHLAALAVEHGATVVTYDSDFGRFPGLTWREPSPLPT